MKKVLLITFLLVLQLFFGQEIPQIKVDEKEKAIQLTELKVQTEIVGNISQTTYEMVFYNPNNRILEGELVFPLGEGQTVTGYALDINGKMRDAVVVEKQKARQTFERVIRQKIDPALLEQSEGNNYKSRIYPLPGKGTRKIKIVFEQELLVKNNRYYYELPLQYKNVKQFDLRVEVFKQKSAPIVHNSDMQFERWEENYVLKYDEQNFIANKTLQIQIPTELLEERILSYEDFIYINKNIKKQAQLKRKPKEISVFWDVSLSQKSKEITKEMALLERYLQELQNVKVNLIVFSNVVVKKETFSIKNGAIKGIKEMLDVIPYDGATSFSQAILKQYQSKENLLFTNGIFNFKKETVSFKNPVYIINSNTVANHVENKRIAQATAGRYINLNRFTEEEALQQLLNEPYRFLGYQSRSTFEATFPAKGTVVNENFTFVGRSKNATQITLLFGYGKKVEDQYKINLDQKGESDLVKRIWAKKKLTELNQNHKENKQKIIAHALENQLITQYTSLIVLDRLEDYLRYEIVPPEELQEQYFAQINRQKEMQKEQEKRIKELRSDLQDEYEDVKKWWAKDVKLPKKKAKTDSLGNIDNDFEESADRVVVGYGTTAEEAAENPPPPDPEVLDDIEPLDDVQEVIVTSNALTTRIQSEALEGAVPEVKIEEMQPGDSRTIKLRSASSIGNTQAPLYVVDGKVVSDISSLSPNEIGSMEVLKDAAATSVYGSRGSNGVIVITTQNGVVISDSIVLGKEEDFKIKNEKSIDYLAELKKASNLKEAYQKYIELRKGQEHNPLFYIDIADYFYKKGEAKQAVKIISNVLELKLDDPELIRLVAYRLESYKMYDEALLVYKKLLEIRPEDIQTYRDVALAYEVTGAYQKAFDQLVYIIEGGLIENDADRRFEGVEQIAFVEATQLLSNHKKKIKTTKKVKPLPVDLRVVLDWNHDNVDIDLWVEDPTGEICKYNHSRTKIGGKMSDDMTEGFGPEEFMLKKAIKGTYKVYANYYGTSSQKISGPTTIKATLFKNYGSSNQTKKVKVVRLNDSKKKKVLLGEIVF